MTSKSSDSDSQPVQPLIHRAEQVREEIRAWEAQCRRLAKSATEQNRGSGWAQSWSQEAERYDYIAEFMGELEAEITRLQQAQQDRDIWKRAWAALFQTLKATHGASGVIDHACHSFHGDENCLLSGPHEGVPHVSVNGVQWES